MQLLFCARDEEGMIRLDSTLETDNPSKAVICFRNFKYLLILFLRSELCCNCKRDPFKGVGHQFVNPRTTFLVEIIYIYI